MYAHAICSFQFETDNCLAGGLVEPYAYHIVNRWFDEFFIQAIEYANQSRHTAMPYRHMVQPWLVALFLDCENAGLLSWPGSGWVVEDTPLLHCPNETVVAEVRAALRRGDLFFHAAPLNVQASYFPDASLFDASLDIAATLSTDLGLPTVPTAVSQRDVPGWTRATVPLLARRGINGISFGAGTPPGENHLV